MLGYLYIHHNLDEYGADRGDGTYGVSDRKLRLFACACAEDAGDAKGWRDWSEREDSRPGYMTAVTATRQWCGYKCGQLDRQILTPDEKCRRAAFLHDILGNPFSPVKCRWCAGDGL